MESIEYLWHFFAKQQRAAVRSTPVKNAMMMSSRETMLSNPVD